MVAPDGANYAWDTIRRWWRVKTDGCMVRKMSHKE
jgi:hypothetical protein